MRVLVFVLILTAGSVQAKDPMGTHFPPCKGGETGYWMPAQDTDGKFYMAVSTHPWVPDPANVVCWIGPEQKVMALPPEKEI